MRVPNGRPFSCENGKQKSTFHFQNPFACRTRKRILEEIPNSFFRLTTTTKTDFKMRVPKGQRLFCENGKLNLIFVFDLTFLAKTENGK